MQKFTVTEMQIVRVTATYEAQNADEAMQFFMNGDEPIQSNSSVQDSYGIAVELAE